MSEHKDRMKKAEEFLSDLKRRGCVHDCTNWNHLVALLAAGKKVYMGIDPTADFLHLGHYFGLNLIRRFVAAGYPAIIIVGSLTARIGDPSWRTQARRFNPNVEHNGQFLRRQLMEMFSKEMGTKSNGVPMLEIVDNYEFHNDRLLGNVDFQKHPVNVLLEFLSEVCSGVKLSELMNREFLKERVMRGLTLQEALYTCLQGWDFLYLFQQKNVAIQLGGSDQWGHMITGLGLINKFVVQGDDEGDDENAETNEGSSVHAGIMTFPIINDASGNKFGKSEGNAIRISGGDPAKNSYIVRQYFMNVPDECIEDYLRKFTNFTLDEIANMVDVGVTSEVKSRLADAVCSDIFGREISLHSELVAKGVFNELAIRKTYEDLREFAKYLPCQHCHWNENIQIFSLFKILAFVSSKSEFNRLVKSRGIFVANVHPEDLNNINCILKSDHVVWQDEKRQNGIVIIRKGKKQYGLVHIQTLNTPLND